MQILLFIPTYKREALTRHVFNYLKNEFIPASPHKVIPFIVYSNPQDEKIVKEFKFKGCFALNKPFGRKLNIGVENALKKKFDFFMQSGSDDLLHPDIWELYEPYFQDNCPFFGLNKMYAYNPKANRLLYTPYHSVLGAARVMTRAVLEKASKVQKVMYNATYSGPQFHAGKGEVRYIRNWKRRSKMYNLVEEKPQIKLFDDARSAAMDTNSETHVYEAFDFKTHYVRTVPSEKAHVMDIKTDMNIHTYDKLVTYAITGKNIEDPLRGRELEGKERKEVLKRFSLWPAGSLEY